MILRRNIDLKTTSPQEIETIVQWVGLPDDLLAKADTIQIAEGIYRSAIHLLIHGTVIFTRRVYY